MLGYRRENESYVFMYISVFAVGLTVGFCVEYVQAGKTNLRWDNKDYIYQAFGEEYFKSQYYTDLKQRSKRKVSLNSIIMTTGMKS